MHQKWLETTELDNRQFEWLICCICFFLCGLLTQDRK